MLRQDSRIRVRGAGLKDVGLEGALGQKLRWVERKSLLKRGGMIFMVEQAPSFGVPRGLT